MRSDREHIVGGEVEFLVLLQALWKEKFIVLLGGLVAAVAALGYVLLTPPVYEARAYLQPPSQNDIASLNYGRGGESGLGMLSTQDVYQFYVLSLRSEFIRKKFFREVYLANLNKEDRRNSQDELYADFSKLLQVVQGNGDAGNLYIRVRLSSPEQAVEWSQHYVQMAGDRARNNVIKDVRADAVVKADNIEQQISAGREVARKQREDQLARLNEALNTARAIGLKEPPIISEPLSAQVSAGMNGALMYMRGSRALESEIENLQSRSSDDPYVPNLRQLQESMAFYRGLRVDPATIEVYTQDGVVDAPDAPIGPKRSLVIFFAVLLGLALGVSVALVKHFAFGRKN